MGEPPVGVKGRHRIGRQQRMGLASKRRPFFGQGRGRFSQGVRDFNVRRPFPDEGADQIQEIEHGTIMPV